MKLYDTSYAPNPRRVRIYLAEKGIEVPKVQVDLMKGEHRQEAYRKIAPNSRVPALQLDDGTVILESIAICRYFETLHPDPPLMGADAKDSAIVEMWQRRMEWELMLPMVLTFRNTHPAMAEREKPEREKAERDRPERAPAGERAEREGRRPSPDQRAPPAAGHHPDPHRGPVPGNHAGGGGGVR